MKVKWRLAVWKPDPSLELSFIREDRYDTRLGDWSVTCRLVNRKGEGYEITQTIVSHAGDGIRSRQVSHYSRLEPTRSIALQVLNHYKWEANNKLLRRAKKKGYISKEVLEANLLNLTTGKRWKGVGS